MVLNSALLDMDHFFVSTSRNLTLIRIVTVVITVFKMCLLLDKMSYLPKLMFKYDILSCQITVVALSLTVTFCTFYFSILINFITFNLKLCFVWDHV